MGARWTRYRALALMVYLRLRHPEPKSSDIDELRSGVLQVMCAFALINVPQLRSALAEMPGENARQVSAWLADIPAFAPLFFSLGLIAAALGLLRIRRGHGETEERKARREAARARTRELSIIAHRAEIDAAAGPAKSRGSREGPRL